VTRSLGNRVASDVDIASVQWGVGDYLLLCSDGLTNMVDNSELSSFIVAGGADIEGSCREAIARANRNGGKDNITAVLAYYD
jgi:protein phosphatase